MNKSDYIRKAYTDIHKELREATETLDYYKRVNAYQSGRSFQRRSTNQVLKWARKCTALKEELQRVEHILINT